MSPDARRIAAWLALVGFVGGTIAFVVFAWPEIARELR